MSSWKTSRIRTNNGPVLFTVEYKEKARLSVCQPLFINDSLFINHVHQSTMHLGWDETLEKLFEYCLFEGMAKYVRKFVENCHARRVSKASSGKVQAELHSIPKTNIPWHIVHVDITGKLSGKNDSKGYVIVLVLSGNLYTCIIFVR